MTTVDPSHPSPSPHGTLAPSALRALVDTELALPSRLGHTLLLVAGIGMGCLFALLLVSEPALPLRTRVAFIGGLGIAILWTAFAAWVLRHRRVLYARHRVIAARLAIAVAAAATVGAVAVVRQGALGYAAVWTSAVLLLAAVLVHQQAMGRVAALERRRDALARALAQTAGTPS
jgi:uncharacterized membrane protein SirB2